MFKLLNKNYVVEYYWRGGGGGVLYCKFFEEGLLYIILV